MALVTLILREDVANLGEAGEVVSVRPGYARNFLIPTGKASLATAANVKQLEHEKRVIAERTARELKEFRAHKDRIEQLALEVRVQVGEEGRLFGSVTSANVAELLAAKGIVIDRRKIELAEPIKEVGDHAVPVRLHREVIATVHLKVAPAE